MRQERKGTSPDGISVKHELAVKLRHRIYVARVRLSSTQSSFPEIRWISTYGLQQFGGADRPRDQMHAAQSVCPVRVCCRCAHDLLPCRVEPWRSGVGAPATPPRPGMCVPRRADRSAGYNPHRVSGRRCRQPPDRPVARHVELVYTGQSGSGARRAPEIDSATFGVACTAPWMARRPAGWADAGYLPSDEYPTAGRAVSDGHNVGRRRRTTDVTRPSVT